MRTAAAKPKAEVQQDERRKVPANSWAMAAIEAEGGGNGDMRCKLERTYGHGGTYEHLTITVNGEKPGSGYHNEHTFTLNSWDAKALGDLIDALSALRVAQLAVSR